MLETLRKKGAKRKAGKRGITSREAPGTLFSLSLSLAYMFPLLSKVEVLRISSVAICFGRVMLHHRVTVTMYFMKGGFG